MAIIERGGQGSRPLSVDAAIETSAPGFTRASQEMAAAFAFESAVDELSYELGRDPVELRLRNDTRQNDITGKRGPSPHLVECLRRGAELFDWSRRSSMPGSMRDADGGWVGLGVAVGAYKATTAAALARVRLNADGSLEASMGGHEVDRGIRVAIALVLAERLGVDLNRIQITIGETLAPRQPLTGESRGMATAASAIHAAAEKIRTELINLATGAEAGPLSGSAADGVTFIDNHLVLPDGRRDSLSIILRRAGRAWIDGEGQQPAAGQSGEAFPWASGSLASTQGPIYPDVGALSFAAHFAEVHINPGTRQVRAAKAIGVFDCGRVVSARMARSRALAGLVWGIGAALSGGNEVDNRFGGLRADMAKGQVPVNVDFQNLIVEFINEPEREIDAIGGTGIDAVASAGTAAAIANAIYHATGRRFRELPIRTDSLFEAG